MDGQRIGFLPGDPFFQRLRIVAIGEKGQVFRFRKAERMAADEGGSDHARGAFVHGAGHDEADSFVVHPLQPAKGQRAVRVVIVLDAGQAGVGQGLPEKNAGEGLPIEPKMGVGPSPARRGNEHAADAVRAENFRERASIRRFARQAKLFQLVPKLLGAPAGAFIFLVKQRAVFPLRGSPRPNEGEGFPVACGLRRSHGPHDLGNARIGLIAEPVGGLADFGAQFRRHRGALPQRPRDRHLGNIQELGDGVEGGALFHGEIDGYRKWDYSCTSRREYEEDGFLNRFIIDFYIDANV